jgi:hypothetical protein
MSGLTLRYAASGRHRAQRPIVRFSAVLGGAAVSLWSISPPEKALQRVSVQSSHSREARIQHMSNRVDAKPDEHKSYEPERAHEPGLHQANYGSENDDDERTNYLSPRRAGVAAGGLR